tara:strand:- start:49 stop:951 length:903 start_codon:yes stop_codon:yes gene_type:complete
MDLVNKWLEKPFKKEDYEDLVKDLEASNPHLEVSECALSLGLEELFQISSVELNEAESLVLELITIRDEGDTEKMFENIQKALELVREKNSRDLVLEGRLRMELGLIKIQTNSEDNPESDFEWALKRLSSVSENSRLHGLSIINKAAYHEHVNELIMALHHYGEIPLKGKFPLEIVGFSRIGAARILVQMQNIADACRHLYNAHNLFKTSNNYELSWHSGFQFLTIAAPYVDVSAERMSVQIVNAKPREVGDEKSEVKIHPSDLKDIAINLKNSNDIFQNVDDTIKEFVNKIIENTELFN